MKTTMGITLILGIVLIITSTTFMTGCTDDKDSVKKVECPNCGAMVDEDVDFCPECGADLPNPNSVTIMYFTVEDGTNINSERGCFFLIKAGKGVDIDPSRYSFYVTEKGFSPHLLDFDKREYNDADPYGPRLDSGDLNGSYDWREEGDLWSDGEYIGFDMPMPDMNIEITEGNIYEVMIKNPNGERIYSDTFVYKSQGWSGM